MPVIKVYIALGVCAMLLFGGFYAGYNFKSGMVAKEKVKITENLIEDDNQDKKEIAEHVKTVYKTVTKVERKIIQLPPITITERCPIGDVIRLQQQTYSNYPSMLFFKHDTVPSSD